MTEPPLVYTALWSGGEESRGTSGSTKAAMYAAWREVASPGRFRQSDLTSGRSGNDDGYASFLQDGFRPLPQEL